jgi:hypothetical protein
MNDVLSHEPTPTTPGRQFAAWFIGLFREIFGASERMPEDGWQFGEGQPPHLNKLLVRLLVDVPLSMITVLVTSFAAWYQETGRGGVGDAHKALVFVMRDMPFMSTDRYTMLVQAVDALVNAPAPPAPEAEAPKDIASAVAKAALERDPEPAPAGEPPLPPNEGLSSS